MSLYLKIQNYRKDKLTKKLGKLARKIKIKELEENISFSNWCCNKDKTEEYVYELNDVVQSKGVGYIDDGYHTFNELYAFRLTYNSLLFNEWYKQGKYNVHKSKRHYDGELCFGGGYFIVVAELPTGQISNHYRMKYWDMFNIRDTDKSECEFDGHTSLDVLERMNNLISTLK